MNCAPFISNSTKNFSIAPNSASQSRAFVFDFARALSNAPDVEAEERRWGGLQQQPALRQLRALQRLTMKFPRGTMRAALRSNIRLSGPMAEGR